MIVFDLDDTLYNEINYVKSGFSEVSKYFATKYLLDENTFFNIMIENLKLHGRGKIFDNTLSFFNILNKKNIKKCISIYRMHLPNIKLPEESQNIINYYKLQNIPMYIVTDGNKLVQYNKIKGLGIEKDFNKVFITHRYGIKNAKPSPYCFIKIAQKEKVDYSDIVYIGDNIKKDFVALKPLGFRTICIKNGMFQDLELSQEYNAEQNIKNLSELQNILKVERVKNEDK